MALTRTSDWTKDVRSALVVLERSRGQLRQAEQLVADFALANPGVVVNCSVTELAKQVGCSEATVLRCSRSLGFGGFPEFKLALARDLARAEEVGDDGGDLVEVDDPVERVTYVAYRNALLSLEDTMQLQQATQLELVVAAVTNARLVVVAGVSSRALLATEAQARLAQVGICANLATQDRSLEPLARAVEGDVLLAFTGASADRWLSEAFRYAQSKRLTTILCTPRVATAMEDLADITVHTASRPFQAGELLLESLVAETALVETLVAACALRRYSDSISHLAAQSALQKRMNNDEG
nr:MurR/RpiR family transcriptional regulator [Streptomyces canus]